MIGTLQPAASNRFLISGTAAAASGTFTVQRTISEPASASSRVCFKVDSTSAVSVLVMDCTTTGAPPPTRTCPTLTPKVLRRGCREPVASNPAIWFSVAMIHNSLANLVGVLPSRLPSVSQLEGQDLAEDSRQFLGESLMSFGGKNTTSMSHSAFMLASRGSSGNSGNCAFCT